jgi:hypothetical protein
MRRFLPTYPSFTLNHFHTFGAIRLTFARCEQVVTDIAQKVIAAAKKVKAAFKV